MTCTLGKLVMVKENALRTIKKNKNNINALTNGIAEVDCNREMMSVSLCFQ